MEDKVLHNNNKFPQQKIFSEIKDYEILLDENKELRVFIIIILLYILKVS